MKKSEQVIAVTGVRSVFPVRVFLADETCFFEVLDGSPDRFFGDTEILGNPFYAGPSLAHGIPAVIKIDVDELRPVGKFVISIQLFEVGHWFVSVKSGSVLTVKNPQTAKTELAACG